MSSYYNEETRWIEGEAKVLAKNWNRSYSLVLFAGLNAYNVGGSPEEIRFAMNDYCWGKQPAPKPSFVHKSGTG